MKKLILLLFTFFGLNAFGQGLTDSYINSGIGYGPRPLAANLNTVDFYIDNNGNQESYTADLSNDLRANGLNIFLGFGRYKGLSHQLFFDLPIGDIKSSKFGYNLGYNIAVEVGRQDLLLRPSVGIATGDGRYDLARQDYTDNTPLVFDTLSLAEPVTYSIKRNVISINPGMEIAYLINQKYAIQLQLHYDIEIANKDHSIDIEAPSLDGPNPNYDFSDRIGVSNNGMALTDKLIDFSGLRISIGISQYINKQLFN